MRYVLTNNDGSIEIVGCRPIEIVRNSDGAVFTVRGSRKRNGNRILYGGFPGTDGGEFIVGNDDFDPADMEADSIPGHTCVFSTVEREKAKRHPVNAAKITGGRKLERAELIASGIGSVNARGRIIHDPTYRGAWEDAGGLRHNMTKCRTIHMDRIRAARNAKLDETDKQVAALDGEPIPQALRALRQKLRDLPATFDLSTATTPAQLKAMWPDELK